MFHRSHCGTAIVRMWWVQRTDAALRAIAEMLRLCVPRFQKRRSLLTTHGLATHPKQVMCRFCAEDLILVSRESMGAPPGVPVYALDGSLINLP